MILNFKHILFMLLLLKEYLLYDLGIEFFFHKNSDNSYYLCAISFVRSISISINYRQSYQVQILKSSVRLYLLEKGSCK